MLKNKPKYTFYELYSACKLGVTGNTNLLKKLNNIEGKIHVLETSYKDNANSGTLYKLQEYGKRHYKKRHRLRNIRRVRLLKNPKLKQQQFTADSLGFFHGVSKHDFLNLYNYYLLDKDKVKARELYDEMLAAYQQKCPYCSGIGRPRNLDHYLPKSHFPEFSILPFNLVASCRDCNMDGKSDNLITCYEKQFIHPYLDKDCFFDEQWIDIKFNSELLEIDTTFYYFTNPPNSWDEKDKERVNNHFIECDLGLRYSVEASSQYIDTITQIKELMSLKLPIARIVKVILEPLLRTPNQGVNHWKKVLATGMKKTLIEKSKKA